MAPARMSRAAKQTASSSTPRKPRFWKTDAPDSPKPQKQPVHVVEDDDEEGDDSMVDDMVLEPGPSDQTKARLRKGSSRAGSRARSATVEREVPAPAAFKPMPRSMLAGMSSLPSGDEGDDEDMSEAPTGHKDAAQGARRFKGDIIIDEFPSDTGRNGLGTGGGPSKHFDPPGLFSTSLMPSLAAGPSGDVHVELSGTGNGDVKLSGEAADEAKSEETLLLPTNVLLDTSTAIERAEEEALGYEDVGMEGLHFVDDDVAKGVTRYFDPSEGAETAGDPEAAFLATADQSKICSNCKKPGHRPRECPHVICTTCGAWDEHDRRDCPHGLICFGCGGRGHRNAECPQRSKSGGRGGGCERCGGRDHKETSCPTIWRVYVYNTPAEREEVLRERTYFTNWEKEAAAGLESELWCYNCAREGHLGDDCPEHRGSLASMRYASAFSHQISSRGPFRGSSLASRISTPRQGQGGQGNHTRWDDSELPDLNPGFGGAQAGRKGKEKQKRKMAQQDREAEDEDDQDWFDRRRGSGPRGRGGGGGGRGGHGRDIRDAPRSAPRKLGDGGRNSRDAGRFDTPTSGGHPFGHAHLMSPSTPMSAPANLRGQTISFGTLSTPGSGSDTPTNQGRNRQNGGSDRGESSSSRDHGGRNALLSRALGSGGPGSRGSPAGSSRAGDSSRGSPLSREGTPSGPATSRSDRKKQRRQPDLTDRDWENDWRKDDRLGGDVRSWGREMDSEERHAKKSFEREQRDRDRGGPSRGGGGSGSGGGGGPPKMSIKGAASGPRAGSSSQTNKPSTGQRYYGGY